MATVRTVSILNSKIETMIIKERSMVEKGLEKLWSRLQNKDTKRVVGLDFIRQFEDGSNGGKKVVVLNLCSASFCLVLRLRKFSSIPSCLFKFLDLPDITFVGVGITGKLTQLRKIDDRLECRNGVELGPLAAAVYGKPFLSAFGLLELINHVLEYDADDDYYGKRSVSAVFGKWDEYFQDLTDEQITHSVAGAYASFLIGNKLLGGYFCHDFAGSSKQAKYDENNDKPK